MKKLLLIPACLMLICCSSEQGYQLSWQKFKMDGHRTGVTAPNADNVTEAMGSCADGVYTSPSGKVFKDGCTPAVAAAMLAVQPEMARLKEVIGHSREAMEKGRPESTLSNWTADVLMELVEEACGRHVDMSVINFGGIRVDMPAGDVLLDDISSMFPFKNKLSYVALKGSDLIRFLEMQAAHSPQALGGVRMEIEDHRLVSATIDGKPIDRNRTYGVGTIDFLLDGGDAVYLAKNAKELIISETLIGTAMVDYVRGLTAAGKDIESSLDGRMVIRNTKKEEKGE